jgi:hypothetical protein
MGAIKKVDAGAKANGSHGTGARGWRWVRVAFDQTSDKPL